MQELAEALPCLNDSLGWIFFLDAIAIAPIAARALTQLLVRRFTQIYLLFPRRPVWAADEVPPVLLHIAFSQVNHLPHGMGQHPHKMFPLSSMNLGRATMWALALPSSPAAYATRV